MVGDATCCIETSLLISEFLGCSSAEIHRSEMGACVIAVGPEIKPAQTCFVAEKQIFVRDSPRHLRFGL